NPEGYVENMTGIAKGLAHGVTHPVEFAKAVVDWDTWMDSPGRALGHLVPLVVLTIASGGAGAAEKGAEAGEVAEDLAAAERIESVAEKGVLGAGEEGAALGPAAQAAALQGRGLYPGVDAWENVTLRAGTRVFAGEPGLTGFATSRGCGGGRRRRRGSQSRASGQPVHGDLPTRPHGVPPNSRCRRRQVIRPSKSAVRTWRT